ncbi:MAG: hypothetical protein ACHP6I_02220 [Rickettsiales bacterium]
MQDISTVVTTTPEDYNSVYDQFKYASLSAFNMYITSRATALEKPEYKALHDVLNSRLSHLQELGFAGDDCEKEVAEACSLQNYLVIHSTFDELETRRLSKYVENKITAVDPNLVSTYLASSAIQDNIMAAAIQVIKNAYWGDKDCTNEKAFLQELGKHIMNHTSLANSSAKLQCFTNMPAGQNLVVKFDEMLGEEIKSYINREQHRAQTAQAK